MAKEKAITNTIENRIFTIRGLKVMLDSDLAELYGVKTHRLNEAVKRNIERFPEDFMFQLTQEEWEDLWQINMFHVEHSLKIDIHVNF